MTHSTSIKSTTIIKYATAEDRIDQFDDSRELRVFKAFLEHWYDPKTYRVVEKPDGPYGVDLALVTTQGDLACAFDLERCLSWRDDWPSHWRSLSFLARKNHYLDFAQFGMVWFNAFLTTCVIAWKDDILLAPVETRRFAKQSYTDRVRLVPFEAGRLIGHQFAPGEMQRFSHRIHFDFSTCL